MLTQMQPRLVETSGVGETAAFTIKANGKAFKVLIDSLYSNKILAVIRELWSNAYDSHVAAGSPQLPFDCHLPTDFEPYFNVRDYGVSLPHHDVMHLYTTVFESTKDGTNTQVGKLGLGSKSPFAYVDTFTVTAWKGGVKRSYSAFIGTDHIPQIALMGEEPSDEPQGLEISFPVQTQDVRAFRLAAQQVARGFEVLPNQIGGILNYDVPEILLQGAGWKLLKAGSGEAFAKQGCVVYPIDPDAIPNILPLEKAVLESPFFIEFPIGDLEIAASREGLGYTPTTCDNIIEAVKRITAELRVEFEKRIEAAETYWDAVGSYYDLLNDSDIAEGVRELLGKGLHWRGRDVFQTISLDKELQRAGVAVMPLTHYELTRRNRINIKWQPRSYVAVEACTLFVFEDATKRVSTPGARIRHWFDRLQNNYNYKGVMWIKADPKSIAFKRLCARLGRPEIIDVETLERPQVLIDRARAKSRVPMRVLPSRWKPKNPASQWERVTVTESDPIVYIELDKGEIVGGTEAAARDLHAKLIAIGEMSALSHIVCVPKSLRHIQNRNPHWVSLWDLARRVGNEMYNPRLWARCAAFKDAINSADKSVKSLVDQMVDNKVVPPQGPLRGLYAIFMHAGPYLRQHANIGRGREILQELDGIGHPSLAVEARPFPVEQLCADADDLYPMLQLVDEINHQNWEVAAHYVNLVDVSQKFSHGASTTDAATGA